MRSGIIFIAVVMLAAGALARPDDSLDQLIKRAKSAPERDQVSLYTEIAERRLQTADQLYSAGQPGAARDAVSDVITYSEKATDASVHSSSRLKQTEIALRKMAAKLRDIRRSISFEDQKPVEEAADRLEKMRTDLLSRMFGSKGEK